MSFFRLSLTLRFFVFIVIFGLASHASAQDLTNWLVRYYKFNESSGTTATDSTGTANGTLSNMGASPWAPAGGQLDGAAYFPGTGTSNVNVSMTNLIYAKTEYSAAVWFKLGSYKLAYPGLISNTINDANGREGFSMNLHDGSVDSTRGVECERRVNNASTAVVMHTTGTEPTGVWIHAVCTYDGSNQRLYVNGVRVATANGNASLPTTGSDTLYIGTNAAVTSGSGFEGYMDEVRIYNRAITADEVKALYNLCRGTTEATIEYFPADNVFRYCDTDYWKRLTLQTTGTACSSAGQMYYDTTNNNMVFCNGTSVLTMGPTSAGGSGCTSPTATKGTLDYDTTNHIYKYCSGAAWVNVGT